MAFSCSAEAPIEFGTYTSADAFGVMLAHSLTVDGHKFRKGHRLTIDDVVLLRGAGVDFVTGARLRADDMAENDVAGVVAGLLAGANVAPRRPNAGRCNIHATTNGILVVDADAIMAANRIDEAITVATLPPWSAVRHGQVIATVKIIPYGVPGSTMAKWSDHLKYRFGHGALPLQVAAFREQRIALISSELPGSQEADPGDPAYIRQRVEKLGSRVALEMRCIHSSSSIAHAFQQAVEAGCTLILFSGAIGTRDRRDVAGLAIGQAGGRIIRFGMPVEPGNMLLFGELEEAPIVVLPRCAHSRRLNGFDWVLLRLLAGLRLDSEVFSAMGVGGLLRSAGEAAEEDMPVTLATVG